MECTHRISQPPTNHPLPLLAPASPFSIWVTLPPHQGQTLPHDTMGWISCLPPLPCHHMDLHDNVLRFALCQLAGPPNVARTRCLPSATYDGSFTQPYTLSLPCASWPSPQCGLPPTAYPIQPVVGPLPPPNLFVPSLPCAGWLGPPNVAYSHCLPPMLSVMSPLPNHSVLSVPRASWQGHPIWPPLPTPNYAACAGPLLPQPFCAKLAPVQAGWATHCGLPPDLHVW